MAGQRRGKIEIPVHLACAENCIGDYRNVVLVCHTYLGHALHLCCVCTHESSLAPRTREGEIDGLDVVKPPGEASETTWSRRPSPRRWVMEHKRPCGCMECSRGCGVMVTFARTRGAYDLGEAQLRGGR